MEIEFSPNQVSTPGATNMVKTARTMPSTANDSAPLQGMAELQQKLNEQALTRPEKMDAARQLLSDVKYPPNELLNGIAHLLAINLSR